MNVNIPRLKPEDVEPILMLLNGLEQTKSKHAKMAITKLIVAYCSSLGIAGLNLHDQVWEEKRKHGQPVEVKSTSWFGK